MQFDLCGQEKESCEGSWLGKVDKGEEMGSVAVKLPQQGIHHPMRSCRGLIPHNGLKVVKQAGCQAMTWRQRLQSCITPASIAFLDAPFWLISNAMSWKHAACMCAGPDLRQALILSTDTLRIC